MLSMKTLRVAIVTMGSALLLGPGLALAQNTYNLDATGRAGDPIKPAQHYATETLVNKETVARRDFYSINNPEADVSGTDRGLEVAVRTARRIESDEDALFLRLELGGGAIFGEGEITDNVAATLMGGNAPDDEGMFNVAHNIEPVSNTNKTAGGSTGSNMIVFRVSGTADIPIGASIIVNLSDDISVPGGTGSYTATITAHTSADDAIDGVGAVSAFGGSGQIISVVHGLNTRLIPRRAVAEVNVGFLWFDAGQPGPDDLMGQAKIGHVSVGPRHLPDMATLYSATDGGVITVGRAAIVDDPDTSENEEMAEVPETISAYLVEAMGVNVVVSGNLSIGAFSFISDSLNADGSSNATCPGGSATTNNPDRGTLVDDDDMPLVSDEGEVSAADMGYSGPLNSGVNSLCVNVDVTGRATNSTPIPSGLYEASVSIQPPGVTDEDDFIDAASGVIGRISRNGTSVNVAYLTASDKYNQRLIIANRGASPARFDIGEFVTEDGADVELTAAAMAAREAGHNVIPAGGQVVLRVDELLSFEGKNRAGATVSVNSNPYNIQVATTQVNLDDGSTDTVVYMSTDDSTAGL